MSYPTSIVLKGDILEDFLTMSDFFKGLDRWEGHKSSYTLNAKRLFDDDQRSWKMFLDLFFPDKVPQLRKLNNGTFSLVPVFAYTEGDEFTLNERLYTVEEVNALFDFLLIDPSIHKEVMDYVKNLHFHFKGRPTPPFRAPPRMGSLPFSMVPQRNNLNFLLNESTNSSNNESEGNNLRLGFKNEEEEETYGKLGAANYKRFAPNGGKSRRRKTRKMKK